MDDKQKQRERLNVFMSALDDYKYGSDEYLECIEFIRDALSNLVGQTWTTAELQEEFIIDDFAYCLAFGRRKSDNSRVSIDFLHHPRLYHSAVDRD